MKFKLKDVHSNPFRDTARYQVNHEKIEALKASIGTTGFWDNVVARQIDNNAAEIAYGEHRRQALLQMYGPEHEIELIIRDLDDATMLRMMANENMQEWGASALVVQETVRAVVLAYADGKIELGRVNDQYQEQLRYAPSFRMGIRSEGSARALPYNAQTVADFLGAAWIKPKDKMASTKVGVALSALELLEESEGELSSDDFKGIGTKQAEVVMRHYRAEKQRHTDPKNKQSSSPNARKAAANVAKKVIADIKAGASTREIQNAFIKERTDTKSKKRNPNILDGLRSLQLSASRLYIFNTNDDREKFEEIIANRDQLSSQEIKDAVSELRKLAGRVTDLANRLEAPLEAYELVVPPSDPLMLTNSGAV